MALEEILPILLGWGSPIGLGIFFAGLFAGLGIFFWGLARAGYRYSGKIKSEKT